MSRVDGCENGEIKEDTHRRDSGNFVACSLMEKPMIRDESAPSLSRHWTVFELIEKRSAKIFSIALYLYISLSCFGFVCCKGHQRWNHVKDNDNPASVHCLIAHVRSSWKGKCWRPIDGAWQVINKIYYYHLRKSLSSEWFLSLSQLILPFQFHGTANSIVLCVYGKQ